MMKKMIFLVVAMLSLTCGKSKFVQQEMYVPPHDSNEGYSLAVAGTYPPKLPHVNTVRLPMVHFYFDRYDINKEAELNLILAKTYIDRYPDVKVMVTGYADERGSVAYNRVLCDLRALSVKRWLSRLGVPSRRILIRNGGERKGVGEEEHAYTRRATLMFVGE
jgi:outer membrane protein OmpA-like peptidoglycan-associated protein